MSRSTCLIVWGVLALGCSEPQGASPDVSRRVITIRAHGAQAAIVLYPRHRIISPVPRIEIATPGETGPVEVTLETSSGRRRVWRTRSRRPDWPEGWTPLQVGESGTVTVRAGGRMARARFQKVAVPPVGLWADASDPAGALLGLDLPIVALRMGLCRTAEQRDEAARRVGLEQGRWWRLVSAGDPGMRPLDGGRR